MLFDLLQRLHMAGAGDVGAFGGGLPAGHGQQLLAQGVEAIAGFGRQHQRGLAARRGSGSSSAKLRGGLGALAAGLIDGHGIGLVPDLQHRYGGGQLLLQGGGDLAVGLGVVGRGHAGQVMQEQHGIGGGDFFPRAGNADALDLVAALAQAGRVDHMQGHAFDLDGLRDLVTRGAGYRRDDGQLGAGQRVEQRAFAGIGLPGDHHLDALTQQGALAGALHDGLHGGAQLVQLAIGIGLLQKVDFLFGEIQGGLDQHAQMHQRIAQAVHLLREGAGQ